VEPAGDEKKGTGSKNHPTNGPLRSRFCYPKETLKRQQKRAEEKRMGSSKSFALVTEGDRSGDEKKVARKRRR